MADFLVGWWGTKTDNGRLVRELIATEVVDAVDAQTAIDNAVMPVGTVPGGDRLYGDTILTCLPIYTVTPAP